MYKKEILNFKNLVHNYALIKLKINYNNNKKLNSKILNIYKITQKFNQINKNFFFKNIKMLLIANNILKLKILNNQNIIFITNNKKLSNLIKQYATMINASYVINNWVTGLFTNWELIYNRIKFLKELEIIYSKSSILYIKNKDKIKLNNLRNKFEGIKNLENMPDLVIFIGDSNNCFKLKECIKMGIPTIALINNYSNFNTNFVTYPILLASNSYSYINTILNFLIF